MKVEELAIDDIEELWSRLNALHHESSTYFKEHFKNLEFRDRREKILSNEKVAIFGIKDKRVVVGYSIATVNSGAGEIYSLFVDETHRGCGIGQALVKHSIRWLESESSGSIRVYVAEGNEQALAFYDSVGFKPRFHVLQLTRD